MAALTMNPPPLMIVYNTETDPWHIRQTRAFQWFFGRYYHYERQMSAPEISQMFSMRIARIWETRGFSMSLLVNDLATFDATLTLHVSNNPPAASIHDGRHSDRSTQAVLRREPRNYDGRRPAAAEPSHRIHQPAADPRASGRITSNTDAKILAS